MKLRKLEIQGFKSFADKTTLVFEDGITGVVGPNGCGKCLRGDSLVQLADGRLSPIKELVEEALSRSGEDTERWSDGWVTYHNPQKISVLSLNPDTLKIEARPVLAFVKRTAPEYLLRIKTRSGREITSTHYHPFFTLKEGELKELRAEELREGAPIALPRCLPIQEVREPVALGENLALFGNDDKAYIPGKGVWNRTRGAYPSPGAENLPEVLEEDLASFLGYLLSENRIAKGYQVRFVNADDALVQEFFRVALHSFGADITANADKGDAKGCLIFSKALCLYLERVFGINLEGKSATRRAPRQIFSSPEPVVLAFLSALFEGDGCLHINRSQGKTAAYWEYSTASRGLAEDVMSLLLRLGVFPILRETWKATTHSNEKTKRLYYSVYVYGLDDTQRLARALRFVGKKRETLHEVLSLKAPPTLNRNGIPGIARWVRRLSRASAVTIKSLRKVHKGRRKDGQGGLQECLRAIREAASAPLLENKDNAQRRLAIPDIYWDEIVSIEKVEGEEWVYDLCVAETHNFVANNFFAHNSNVVESIRWVMGEQRAKALRGGSMEDVIFNGSEGRRPLGMAEVKATFQINPGDLPRPFSDLSEITIGRRLFRGGGAEYFINKSPCRLRDITELFLGTGAGKSSYSVIEQGRVAGLVTARPEERRTILEEAAGITRYQRRREEASRKIEATRQNLARVNDIVGELEKRLSSLKGQAEKAERFTRLRAEARRLELHFAAAKELELLALSRFQEDLVRRLKEEHQAAQARLSQAEEELRAARSAQEECLASLARLEQEVYGAENRVKLAEAELAHAEREKEELGRRIVEAERELNSAQESLRALEEERLHLEEERAQARAAGDEAEAEVAKAEEAWRQASSRASQLEERLKELRDEEAEASRERAQAIARLEGLLRQRADLEERLDALAAERDQEQETADALLEQVKACESRLARDRERQADLAEKRKAAEDALEKARQERKNALAAAETLRADLSGAQSRLSSLQAIAKRYEGFSRGVKEVMNRHKDPAAAGILGVVADLIDCPPHLQEALAAALGDRLEAIVVDEPERAIEEAQFLAQNRGRALFLPLEAKERKRPQLKALPADAIVDLSGVVNAPKEVAEAVSTLLQGALALPDLAGALSAWRQGWREGTLATLKGEAVDPEGVLRVGKGGGETHAEILKRRREIRELETQVAQWKEELKVREGQVVAASRALEAKEKERDSLRRQEDELAFALKNTEADKKRAEAEAMRHTGRARQLGEERLRGISRLAELEAEHTELEAERDEAAFREEGARLALGKALREAGEEKSKMAQAQEALSAARVRAAQARERALSAAQALARQERSRQDLTTRAARAQAALSAARERKRQLEEENATRREDTARLREIYESLRENLGKAREKAQSAKELTEAKDLAVEEARRQEGKASAQLASAEGRAREITISREHSRTALHSRFRLLPEEILCDFHLLAPPTQAEKRRLSLLEREIEALGEVNLTAIDEYKQESERYQFLLGQKNDLEGALDSLEKAISRLNRSSRELFKETFEAVNRHFSILFRRLFRGGDAHLALTDADDPLEAGVEIFAQPPGKRLQSVGLLSGGEKALTAVALTFGIFLLRPSPFCILDEVDAPLDEANVGRFCEMIRELQGATQFVMVTHNQRAMEITDTLYGVTMEEPGVSKIVSVRLHNVRETQSA